MPLKSAAILRWTGRGRLADLQSSIKFVLRMNAVKGRVSGIGNSVVVEGPEPLGLAALLGNMPGVSWVAAGTSARPYRELAAASRSLARNYLKRGDRFSVGAEGTEGVLASDLAGSVTSAILDSVKGSRVSAESPKIRFRAACDGGRGVVGVEVKKGPGGAPMGTDSVSCLVSGGMHSSVLAWEAVLHGFRVRLVHSRSSDEGLRSVARLYSELSHRADPRGLSLEVLEGGSVVGALYKYARRSSDPVFAAFTPTTAAAARRLPSVLAPLFLLPEERFQAEYESLGIKGVDSVERWAAKRGEEVRVRTFGGKVADVSGVLDGLRWQTLRIQPALTS